MKLIKTDVNYLLQDEDGVIIASTSLKNNELSLSLQNCHAIERGYDLEEVINDYTYNNVPPIPNEYADAKFYFREGFQKALELMEGKIFSESDMLECWNAALTPSNSWAQFMESLLQTEWNVVVETDEHGQIFLRRLI